MMPAPSAILLSTAYDLDHERPIRLVVVCDGLRWFAVKAIGNAVDRSHLTGQRFGNVPARDGLELRARFLRIFVSDELSKDLTQSIAIRFLFPTTARIARLARLECHLSSTAM
jgi:hypothetical protein